MLFDGEKTFIEQDNDPKFFFITAPSKSLAVLEILKNRELMVNILDHFEILNCFDREDECDQFLGMTVDRDTNDDSNDEEGDAEYNEKNQDTQHEEGDTQHNEEVGRKRDEEIEDNIIQQIDQFYSTNPIRFIVDCEESWGSPFSIALIDTEETMFRIIKSIYNI